jgi:hypothetical protein
MLGKYSELQPSLKIMSLETESPDQVALFVLHLVGLDDSWHHGRAHAEGRCHMWRQEAIRW